MLQLEYDLTPDEHGVVDGRALARLLIADAYKALAPYAALCPACADGLFAHIANDVIAVQHEESRGRGSLPGKVYTSRCATAESVECHMDRARAEVAKIFETTHERHSVIPATAEPFDDDVPF